MGVIPGLTTAGLQIGSTAKKANAMDPFGIGALITGGAGAIANIIGARQQAKLQKDQLEQDKKQFGVQATQLDPFAQQKQRQKQALLSQIVSKFQPSAYADGKFNNSLGQQLPAMFQGASSFFGPEAMAGAESAFHKTVGAASPTYNPGARTTLGYEAGTGPAADPLEGHYGGPFGGLIRNMSPENKAVFLKRLQAKGRGNAF